MEYKNGTATYQDVVNLINSRIGAALPNSQRELDLKQALIDLDQFETKKNLDIKRAELKSKYAKGGISAQEELLIEKQLLPFFKQGTPDYSEQLSNIAIATENAAVENKNQRISQIQAELSSGGTTPEEEIELYSEARDMSEKGSEEHSLFQQKVNEAKVKKEEQDTSNKANDRYVELIEKYKEGGLTNQESLAIVQDLQTIYKPGSEEFIKMKESEADLLGAIAKEGQAGAGRAQAEEEDKRAAEYNALNLQAEALGERFARGGIGADEYLRQSQNLAQLQQDIATNYDILSPEGTAELQNRFQQIQEQMNLMKSGRAVVANLGSSAGGASLQGLVPLSELASYAETKRVLDDNGDLVEGKIITIKDADGKQRKVLVSDSGELLEVEEVTVKTGGVAGIGAKKETAFRKTGNPITLTKQTLIERPADIVPQQTAAPLSTLQPSSVSTSSGNKSSGGSKSSKNQTPMIKAQTPIPSVTKTTVSAPKAQTSVKSATVLNKSSLTVPKAPSLLRPQPGKVKGTLDFGISEAANKAKNAIKNLFK